MTAKEVDMWELEMREVKEESKEVDENEEEFDDGEDFEEEDMAEEDMSRDDLDLKREGFVKEEEAAGGPVKKAGRFEYACKACGHKAGAKRNLRKHMHAVHPSLLQYNTCTSCEFTTPWKDSLRHHEKQHDLPEDWNRVVCHHCPFFYRHDPLEPKAKRKCEQLLNQHMNDEHEEQKLPCSDCDRKFWTEKQRTAHAKSHTYQKVGSLLSCPSCDYTCHKSTRLTNHMNAVHLGVKPFHCDQCPSAFPNRSGLKQHMISHTGERPYKCPYCGKGVQSKQSLTSHIRTHTGEKPFTCDECGKSFSDQAFFTKHKRLHITDEDGNQVKEFVCSICSKGFTRIVYLKSHMLGHETGRLGSSKCASLKYDNKFKMEAVQRCKEVGLSQASEELRVRYDTLKGWVLVANQPHICPTCKKGFAYLYELKTHMKIHSSEAAGGSPEEKKSMFVKRYSASEKSEVVAYSEIHGVKEASDHFSVALSTVKSWIQKRQSPSNCDICGKTFSNGSMLRRHQEQVHHIQAEAPAEAHGGVSLSFSEYLKGHNLLPSEEEVMRRREEKEEEKRKAEEAVREAMIRKQQEEVFRQTEELFKDRDLGGDFGEGGSASLQPDDLIRSAMASYDMQLASASNDQSRESETDGATGIVEDIKVEFNPEEEQDEEPFEEESDADDYDLGGYDDDDSDEEMEEKVDTKALAFSPNASKEEAAVKEEDVKMEPDDEEDEDEDYVGGEKGEKKKRKRWTPPEGGPCEWCGMTFKEPSYLRDHQLRRHPEELAEKTGTPIERHQCPFCVKIFTVRKDFERHSKRSHGPQGGKRSKDFICDLCGFATTQASYLKEHRTRKHGLDEMAVKEFPCGHCGKVFSQIGNLQRHVAVMHEDPKLQCAECPQMFHHKRELTRHSWSHGPPQFPCTRCDQAFRNPDQLENHVQVEHEKKKAVLRCEECDREFSTKSSLRIHMSHFHLGTVGQHPCHLCEKVLTTAKLLELHVQRHEDYFPCEECGNGYKSNATLKAHIAAVHRGEKIHNCDICGKSYPRLSTLKLHKKTHRSTKEFQCLYCNQQYGAGGKRNIVGHMERVHSEMPRQYRHDDLTEGVKVVSF